MHALIENGAVKRYPYSEWDLKKANPQVSFPAQLTDKVLADFGVHRVFNSTPPTVTRDQVLKEGPPVFDARANRWTQVFAVRDKSAEEIAAETQAQADAVRAERNAKLAATDWTQVADAPVDQQAWATYRQALRDMSTQAGFPWAIEWPQAPV